LRSAGANAVVSPSRIAGRVDRPGVYLLRVAFNPYWKVEQGSLCLSRGSGRTTLLHAYRAGQFTLQAIESPTALLATLTGRRPAQCRSRE